MKRRLSSQFLLNYLTVFLLSLLAAALAFLFLSFVSPAISRNLMKNVYPASKLMRDDIAGIDAAPVVENGGGVQVIDAQYRVVSTHGLDIIGKTQLTAGEFTDFLTGSQAVGLPYHIDVVYNPRAHFWLVVTFPTSIRLDVDLAYNRSAASRDMGTVAGAFAAGIGFYLLLLALFAVVFSRVTSVRITTPLRKLCEGARRLREGDYSARVNLRLKNEFAELQDTFNDMAERIERETALRKQADDDRKRLILDVSHDLKNPLASITGYAELCLKRAEQLGEEVASYVNVILKNARRANRLLMGLFELSKLDSPEFKLKPRRTDACEYLRQACGELLPALERAGFAYEFDIPDQPAYAMIDAEQMSRVLHNLSDNATRYNPKGTAVSVRLWEETDAIVILFQDDGVGIPPELAKDIFLPFVRADDSRNSRTGGTGLGLSIAQRIVQAHGGSLALLANTHRGCLFRIILPRV